MSRMIKLNTTERFNDIVRGFAEWLRNQKLIDGRVKFNTDLGKVEAKTTLTFTGAAWMKMQYLVFRTNTNEVGWHMVCKREDDGYRVEDILIYPQTVAGATVNTDQKEYEEWLNGLPDEVFNNLRGHGHSHVRMGVNPSGVDLQHQDGILEQLTDDMFYMFCIFNQLGDTNIRIFDFKKNVLFETADVEVLVEEDGGFFDFYEDSNDKIQTKKYTAVTTKTASTTTGSTYSTYSGSTSSTYSSKSATAKNSGAWADMFDYDDPLNDYWGG